MRIDRKETYEVVDAQTRGDRVPGGGTGHRTRFETRILLHLAIVLVIGSSALVGGGRQQLLPPSDALRAAPSPASLPPSAGQRAIAPSNSEPTGSPSAGPSHDREEGALAVRAMASSRGGARTLEAVPSPVPSATPTPAPRREPLKAQSYRVQAGDSLLGIAYRFGVTPETILWANDLGNGDLLQIDDELTILPVSGVLHKVKGGDTLSGIAEAYGADTARLVEANLLGDADSLQEGQMLIVPGGMMRTTEPITGPPSVSIEQQPPQPATSPAPQPAPQPDPAPQPAPTPAPAGGGGDRIAAISQQYLGYRYVWGGHAPSGFDCSGFTWYVYKEAGINIPLHDLAGQLNAGPRIARDQLQPGDLVFFQNTYKAGLSHSGIYLGGGRFINAETERAGVQIRSLSDPYWSPRFVGGSRPW